MSPKQHGLNFRQNIFVQEYLINKNATRAAIAAGYSKKTARSIGAENLTKPNIAAEIEKGLSLQENATKQIIHEISQLRDIYCDCLNWALMSTAAELEAAVEDSKTPAFQVCLAVTLLDAVKKGKWQVGDRIISRLIGKGPLNRPDSRSTVIVFDQEKLKAAILKIQNEI